MTADFSHVDRLISVLGRERFRLVGGLAVQALTRNVSVAEVEHIASATQDVDIATSEAIGNLAAIAGIRVDVLDFEISDDDLFVEEEGHRITVRLPDETRIVRLPGSDREVVIAGPATLIAMKAAAASAPRGKRRTDHADIALLAVEERLRPTGVSALLEAWRPKMRAGLRSSIAAVRAAFATDESEGPVAFANVVREAAAILEYEEWVSKEAVALREASVAVRLALRAFE